METYHYPYFPPSLNTVHIALFTNVSNAAQLRNRLIHASTMAGPAGAAEREAVNFAFIDARFICSLLHLRTAILQAVITQTHDALRTKSIHSEIIWALSPGTNITEAIRRFGISNSSTSVLVVRIAPAELMNTQSRMMQVVSGRLASLDTISAFTDWTSVRKYYKLDIQRSTTLQDVDSQDELAMVHELVISTVATKGVMT